jgi:hypothetical protein
MPRFVILEHDQPVLHWDFMLEVGPALRTWRLAEPPQPGRPVRAEEIAPHRLAYVEYEGPVSGGRGRVARWDVGTYTGEASGERVTVFLEGRRLRCRAVLRQDAAGAWWEFEGLPRSP